LGSRLSPEKPAKFDKEVVKILEHVSDVVSEKGYEYLENRLFYWGRNKVLIKPGMREACVARTQFTLLSQNNTQGPTVNAAEKLQEWKSHHPKKFAKLRKELLSRQRKMFTYKERHAIIEKHRQ
jgi:hypothetical protein